MIKFYPYGDIGAEGPGFGIEGKIGDADRVVSCKCRRGQLSERCVGHVAIEIAAQIGVLFDRIDDPAIGVDQIEVVELGRAHEARILLVKALVGVGVFKRVGNHGVGVGRKRPIVCRALAIDAKDRVQHVARHLRIGIDLAEGVGKAIEIADGIADGVRLGQRIGLPEGKGQVLVELGALGIAHEGEAGEGFVLDIGVEDGKEHYGRQNQRNRGDGDQNREQAAAETLRCQPKPAH